MGGAVTGGPGAAAKVAARGLNCPSCGAALTVRAFEHTISVVCGSCQSVLDAKDPNLRVLQRFAQAKRVEPRIPLGTRGTWRGRPYEVIGFQRRTIHVEGTPYSWDEYLLFNPYAGFRYLTEYAGHWNDVTTVRSIPEERTAGRPVARLGGRSFRHFQTAEASTTYVLGEFPWQVRVGDSAKSRDFIAPPYILSAEETEGEKTWSLGEYVGGAEVWKAFGLPGSPPRASGVFANQPSPEPGGERRTMWTLFLTFVGIVVAFAAWRAVHGSAEVFRQSYVLGPGDDEPFVTQPFTLGGRPSNVELRIQTDVQNGWAYFNFALVNLASGTASDFGREVSYYEGVEDGEAWHEGSRTDDVRIPTVPPGRYYLRVDPELPADAARSVRYTLTLRRDVPGWRYFLVVLVLLAVPPLKTVGRGASFERARWAESDYPPAGLGGDDD